MSDAPPPLAAAAPAVTALAPIAPRIRVRVFVDFWNFSLEQARAALAPNWLVGYQQYVGALPH